MKFLNTDQAFQIVVTMIQTGSIKAPVIIDSVDGSLTHVDKKKLENFKKRILETISVLCRSNNEG